MFYGSMIRIGLFVFSSFVAIYWGFFALDSKEAVAWVKRFGYWCMFANFSLWLWFAARAYLPRLRVWWSSLSWRHDRIAWQFGFILAVWMLVVGMQPMGYKIVMDEPVLGATALRMHEHREVMVTARAHDLQGVFTQLDGYVDKRPFFYPFLVSIMHDLTGFRSNNPFLLNHFLGLVFLVLLFYLGSRFWPKYGGWVAVILFAGVPLLSISVNGGGLGMLNLVMIALCGIFAKAYLDCPDPLSLNLLVLSGALLAQVRYESVLFVLPVAMIVLLGWWEKRQVMMTWTAILIPLFLVPFALQRVIFFTDYDPWEMREGATEAFSLSLIPENLLESSGYFFSLMNIDQPNSLLLSLWFLLSIMIAVYLLLSGRISVDASRTGARAVICFSSVILFNFWLLMAYHWGQLNDIMATRIVLPFLLFQVLFICWVFRNLRYADAVGKGAVTVSVLYFIGASLPLSSKSDFLQYVPGQHEVLQVRQWTQRFAAQKVLMISDRHLVSIAERAASITVDYAKERKARLDLHLQLRSYDDVYLMHRFVADPEGHAGLIPESPVYHDFKLEPVELKKLGHRRYMQLSRLTGVHWLPGDERLSLRVKQVPEDGQSQLLFLAETLP